MVASGSLFSQQRASELNRSKASGTVTQNSAAISDAPFLRHPIQFGPNSLELTVAPGGEEAPMFRRRRQQ